ncbi:hypothetical protein, partial [uncultured Dialister sp.]|uniref:hypothetical protein n=1 Tax=uncultured Dialister sp. TaxID=278064 RepID=UPI002609745B
MKFEYKTGKRKYRDLPHVAEPNANRWNLVRWKRWWRIEVRSEELGMSFLYNSKYRELGKVV